MAATAFVAPSTVKMVVNGCWLSCPTSLSRETRMVSIYYFNENICDLHCNKHCLVIIIYIIHDKI